MLYFFLFVFFLFTILGIKANIHERSHQAMICWKCTCSTHCSCNADIFFGHRHNNIVQEVPIFRTWVHPCRLVHAFLSE